MLVGESAQVRLAGRRIQLDEHLPLRTGWPSRTRMARTIPPSSGWTTFEWPLGISLP